jgi:hypothetical protein
MPQPALKVLDGGRADKCGPTPATVERDARVEFDGIVEWIESQACQARRFVGVETALVTRVFALGRLLVRLYLAIRERRVAEALPSRSRVESMGSGTSFGQRSDGRWVRSSARSATGAATSSPKGGRGAGSTLWTKSWG